MTGFEGIGGLVPVITMYIVGGISVLPGSIRGMKVGLKNIGTKKSIFIESSVFTFFTMLLFAIVISLHPRIDYKFGIYLYLFVFLPFSIIFSYMNSLIAVWIINKDFISKYRYTTIFISSLIVFGGVSLPNESLNSGLIAISVFWLLCAAHLIIKRLYKSTDILIYSLLGFLGSGLYFLSGFLIFMLLILFINS